MKTVLITFFDIRCIVHFQFIPQGQSFNQTYYVEMLKQVHEAVLRESSELWSNNWILQHDSAVAHKALSVKQFLPQESITGMKYQPDLALNDF
jgi:hypothetical protein